GQHPIMQVLSGEERSAVRGLRRGAIIPTGVREERSMIGIIRSTVAVVTLTIGSGTASPDANNSSGVGAFVPKLAFSATLTGAQQVPEVASAAVGTATAQFDSGFTRVDVLIRLQGDIQVIAGHFHCARAGDNGLVVFGLLGPGPLTEIV